jgi:DNA-binding Xre family transcriptional regulator
MSKLKITNIDLATNYSILDKFIESDKFKKVYAEENLMLRIRNRIKEIIEQKHLTQDELAQKMGVDQKQVHRLIAGKGGFTFATLQKFCYATDSSLELNLN